MKVIIAGSRIIKDYELLERAIKKSKFEITEVVCGMAKGVDSLGLKWAEEHNVPVKKFPADWEKFGKGAGMIRNQQMAEYADCAIVIHLKTKGSINMINRMKELNKPVFDVPLMGVQMKIEFDTPTTGLLKRSSDDDPGCLGCASVKREIVKLYVGEPK
jgi:hypothetical protein